MSPQHGGVIVAKVGPAFREPPVSIESLMAAGWTIAAIALLFGALLVGVRWFFARD